MHETRRGAMLRHLERKEHAWMDVVRWCVNQVMCLLRILVGMHSPPRRDPNKHEPYERKHMRDELVKRGYREDWETMIEKEFRRLQGTKDKERGVYLDSAGAALYSQSQVEQLSELMSQNVLRNPHSAAAEDPRDALRKRCLAHCNASAEEYVCVLTASATSSIHTAVQMIPWKEGDVYLYTRACHNSLMGARNIALERGAFACPVELSCETSPCGKDVVDDKESACSFGKDGKEGSKATHTDGLRQETEACQSEHVEDSPTTHRTQGDATYQQLTGGQACTTARNHCTKHWTLRIDSLCLKRDTTAICPSQSSNCRQENKATSTKGLNCIMQDSFKAIPNSRVVLLALPHECNVSGYRTDLSVVGAAQKGPLFLVPDRSSTLGSKNFHEEDHGTVNGQNPATSRTSSVGNAMVLLDAARSGGTLPPDLKQHRADFVVLSFYKIFGLPTSGGALLVRKETLQKLQKLQICPCSLYEKKVIGDVFSGIGADKCLHMEAKVQAQSRWQQSDTRNSRKVPKGSESLFLNTRNESCAPSATCNGKDVELGTGKAVQGCGPESGSTADIMLKDKSICGIQSIYSTGDVVAPKQNSTFAHVAFGGGSLLACTPDRDCAIRRPAPEGLEGGSPDFVGHHAALIGFHHLDALGGSLALYQHAMALRNYALEYMSHLVHPVSQHPVFALYGVDHCLGQSHLSGHLGIGNVGKETKNLFSLKEFNTYPAAGGKKGRMSASGVHGDQTHTFKVCECGGETSASPISETNSPFEQHQQPSTSMETDDDYPYGPTIAFNIFQADGTLVGHNQVVFLAELNNIYLRGGRFCNPGAASKYWQVDLEELVAGCTSGLDCKSGGVEFIDGVPTGALRISFGYYNTLADLTEFFSFVEKNFLLDSSKEAREEGKYSFPVSKAASLSNETKVTIKKIILYPIKSCSGQEVSQWDCKAGRGLLFDREWLLVDALGKPLSSKSVPKMKAIVPYVDLNKNTLFIRADHRVSRGLSICTLAVLLQSSGSASATSEVAESSLKSLLMANDVVYARNEDDPLVVEWFKKVIGEEVRLVRASHACQSSYANTGDLHLISQQSLLDLEGRMNASGELKPQCSERRVNWQNFRPNIVIDGNFAYEEDETKCYVISEGKELQLEAPCTRCSAVNIDKNSKEPLYTLSQYRRNKCGVAFGVLLSYQDSLGQNAQSTAISIGQVIKAVQY